MFYRCLSVHRVGGGGVHQQADTPSPEMATAVDGTHPTGMHSCYTCLSVHREKGGYDITSCMVPCPSWGEVGQGLCLQGEFASREGDQVLAFWHKWHFGTSSRRPLMPEGQWPSVISTGLL